MEFVFPAQKKNRPDHKLTQGINIQQ